MLVSLSSGGISFLWLERACCIVEPHEMRQVTIPFQHDALGTVGNIDGVIETRSTSNGNID